MLNGALYRQGLRASWKPLVIFLAVLTMYDAVIVSMFDPRIGDLLATLMQTMPDIMAMFGMNNPGATLAEFLANYLYGFLMLIFPLVFSAMTANSLVARHVDRGSMAYLLAAPNSRTRVAFTQMTVLLTGVTAIIAVCTAVGWGCSAAMFPGALDVAGYLRLNLGVWLLHLCLSGLCFFASCISNTTRLSLALGRPRCFTSSRCWPTWAASWKPCGISPCLPCFSLISCWPGRRPAGSSPRCWAC